MPTPVPQNIAPLPAPAELDEWGTKLNKAITDRTSAPYIESQLPARLDPDALEAAYGGAANAGLSAYEVWLEAGNTGTVAQYLASLKGADGSPGPGVHVYPSFADAPALPSGSVVISVSGN